MPKEAKPAKTAAQMGKKGPTKAGGGVARGLWPRVAELRAEGRNAVQIGQEIGRHPATVTRTLKEPAVIADIERIQQDRRAALNQDIQAAASHAWAVLVLKLAAEREDLQIRAACEVLDRAGVTARKELTINQQPTEPTQPAEPDISTPAGIAALREQLARIPPRLLEEALAAAREQG